MDLRDTQMRPVVGGYDLQWEDIAIQASIRQVREDGRGIRAELKVSTRRFGYSELLYRNIVSLLSPNSKGAMAKDLERRFPLKGMEETVPLWPDRLEHMADSVVTAHRKGQPVEDIGDQPIREASAYRVKPFLPEMVPTVLFGEGGSGKSYFALVLGLLVCSGEERLGLRVQQGNVLYLDYETCFADLNERSRALQAGLELSKTILQYRRCEMPLVREIERIAKLVERYEFELVIIDSVGLSLAGTGNDDEVINEYFTALRGLRVTTLLVDHMSKTSDGKTPFGSVYKNNSARSTWRVASKHPIGSDSLDVGLIHAKVNEGSPHNPLAFHFDFTNNEHNRVVRADVSRTEAADALFEHLSDSERILAVLKEGGKLHYKELAAETGISPKNASVYLGRLREADQVVQLGAGYWGLKADEIAF